VRVSASSEDSEVSVRQLSDDGVFQRKIVSRGVLIDLIVNYKPIHASILDAGFASARLLDLVGCRDRKFVLCCPNRKYMLPRLRILRSREAVVPHGLVHAKYSRNREVVVSNRLPRRL
jgi:hypothetical protein